jgi:hypothetical protein
MSTLRVLVCGGRTYGRLLGGFLTIAREKVDREVAALNETLDRLHAQHGLTAIIHGGAPGADRLAGQWARRAGVPITSFPADWHAHGRAAGPIRNRRMIEEGRPDLVLAAPGGRGTADCVRQARAAGIPVREIGARP